MENYPRGGIKYLVCYTHLAHFLKLKLGRQENGLHMLRKAGIQVILDHHALPGVQTVN